jgi:hypothetical protein
MSLFPEIVPPGRAPQRQRAPESSAGARNVIDAQPAAGETAGRITRP